MKFKFTWAHGIIIALASFIIFISYMVFTIEFSKNSFDLVTDDYYEDEIYFQKEIDAIERAQKLAEKPQVSILESQGIKITFPKDFNSLNTTGRFQLFRANSKDLDINKKSLDFETGNSILIPVKLLVKGNYVLKLYWEKDKDKYQMEIPIVWK
ncbi:FixH family protein [Apibacter sp. HY039]|uniref:FixH family protein n=1 Tax=Apibacter sp. HY039 TaxID=2501476 RepID=UPI000FEBFEF6|nr:FixH family protein [Apibacter sp. HY039]